MSASSDTPISAAEQGRRDGVDAVNECLEEQGRDAVIATLTAGHLGWDEAAINARAHALRGVGDVYKDAYYQAYEAAARGRAEEIRDNQIA